MKRKKCAKDEHELKVAKTNCMFAGQFLFPLLFHFYFFLSFSFLSKHD